MNEYFTQKKVNKHIKQRNYVVHFRSCPINFGKAYKPYVHIKIVLTYIYSYFLNRNEMSKKNESSCCLKWIQYLGPTWLWAPWSSWQLELVHLLSKHLLSSGVLKRKQNALRLHKRVVGKCLLSILMCEDAEHWCVCLCSCVLIVQVFPILQVV